MRWLPPTASWANPAYGPRLRLCLGLSVLVAWMGLWWHLGHTTLSLGAHRWDDFRYASRALEGAFDSGVRNRYAHIWGLRAFYSLYDNRFAAALAYACTMSLGLMGTAFALGKRVGGLPAGLLAAGLLPFFPPVMRYFSAPTCDAPSALYAALALLAALAFADGRRHPAVAVLAGLLCFASVKSKETGIAVVPVVVWALTLHPTPDRHPYRPADWRRPVLYWVSGAVLGQLGLCLIDLLVTGDALASLRPRHYQNYAKLIASDPAPYRGGGNHMRRDWVGILVSRDVRSFTLLGLLGLALGVRRSRTLYALALWATGGLLFSAWVSFRYSGIDARTRYLAALAVPLAVATAYLVTQLFTWRPAAGDTRGGAGADQAPAKRAMGTGYGAGYGAIYLGGVAVTAWVAYRALRAGWLESAGAAMAYADERASYFFLPLLVPVALFIAWTTWHAPIRRLALLVVLCATCMLSIPASKDYIVTWRTSIRGWHSLARYMQAKGIDHLARYQVSGGRLHPPLVQWRTRALTHLPGVTERHVGKPDALREDELLITQQRDRKAAEAAGLRPLLGLELGKGRFVVWRR